MPPLPASLSFFILCGLTSVGGYTYQTEPLFLTFSELAALEAESRREDADRAPPSAGEDQVEVRCHEGSMEVVLGAPRFDPGLHAEPHRVRLGPVPAPPCTGRLSGPGEISIRAPLGHCGGTVTWSEAALLYTNLLLYLPPPAAAGGFHGWGAAIPVQCQYRRRFMVSKPKPIWSPLFSHPARSRQPSFSSHKRSQAIGRFRR
ncbi:unnamed protein product [Ophioblennius macclurei]